MNMYQLTEQDRASFIKTVQQRAPHINSLDPDHPQFHEIARQTIKKFTVHQIGSTNKTDGDSRSAIDLFRKAGFRVNVELTPPGTTHPNPQYICIDTGRQWGCYHSDESGRTIIDHHGIPKDEQGNILPIDTSATEITHELLTEFGFMPREESLTRAASLTSEIDNLDFPPHWFKNSAWNISGLVKNGPLEYQQILIEEFEDPHRRLTQQEIKDAAKLIPELKLEYRQSERQIKLDAANRRLERMLRSGQALSDNQGRTILINEDGFLPLGASAAYSNPDIQLYLDIQSGRDYAKLSAPPKQLIEPSLAANLGGEQVRYNIVILPNNGPDFLTQTIKILGADPKAYTPPQIHPQK